MTNNVWIICVIIIFGLAAALLYYFNKVKAGCVSSTYTKVVSTDLKNIGDYNCPTTLGAPLCAFKAPSIAILQTLCSADPTCVGFTATKTPDTNGNYSSWNKNTIATTSQIASTVVDLYTKN